MDATRAVRTARNLTAQRVCYVPLYLYLHLLGGLEKWSEWVRAGGRAALLRQLQLQLQLQLACLLRNTCLLLPALLLGTVGRNGSMQM